MRIDSNEKIAEVPILKVRKLLRHVDNEMEWGKKFVVSLLEISPKMANRLLQELERKGYIKPSRILDRQQLWCKTLKGSTLGLASAAKPVNRKTADRIFSEFIDRVKRINTDSYFLYKVNKVIVFGSYLTDAQKLNDLDIAVELTPKEKDPKLGVELFQQRSWEAERDGRNFDTFIDRLCWPETEVKLFLKSRSRTISLHSISDQIIDRVDHKIVFSDE